MGRKSDLLAFLVFFSLSAAAQPPGAPAPDRHEPRTLLLCVDGVGYPLVEEMYEKGELSHFRRPSRLVAAFPSLTAPALAEMLAPLGSPPAHGYEDYYFDPAENEMAGGFLHRFRKRDFIDGTFRELFDWHVHPVIMTMEYSLPVLGPWLTGHLEVNRLLAEFKDSDQPYYLAYLDATDPLAHLSGNRFLRGLLKRLDGKIPELEKEMGRPVEVIVFSDHGNDPRRYRRAPLREALEAGGFEIEKEIRAPHEVVLPQYGLVGSAVIYTRRSAESAVAEALRPVQGVDLLAYRTGENSLVVLNAAGRAHLFRERDLYAYLPVRGDPLGLLPVLETLRAQGRLDARGRASAEDWWRATRDHVYPDPLRRLWSAFEGIVAQPASVLVSLEDGYYTGNQVFDLFTPLQATHGNLRQAQSTAFILTTGRPFPAFVRGDRFLERVRQRRLLEPAPRAAH